MKKLVVVQALLLFFALLLGILVRNGTALEVSQHHGLVARLAGLIVLLTLAASFIKKHSGVVKILCLSILISTGIASYGGVSFSGSGDAVPLNIMIVSGIVSFILTLTLLKVVSAIKH